VTHPPQHISLAQSFLGELQHEGAQTRTILALVPERHADWKPHAKSFALGKLAVHVADMYSWVVGAMEHTEIDFATGYPMSSFTTTADLLALFDQNFAAASAAFEGKSDAHFMAPWSLRNGEHIFYTLPRGQCLRSTVFNHIIHHRAQLTVYLRLLDVPIPGLYGPSADET